MNAATVKKVVLKSFEEQGLIGLCAKFQLSHFHLIHFKHHTFDKYFTKNISHESLGSFSPVPNSFGNLKFVGV